MKRTEPVRPWEWATLGLLLLILGVICGAAIAKGAPLIYDEAVYALRVRDILGDVHGYYWFDVRASGLPLLLTPLWVLLGGTDIALRAGALLLAMGAVVLVWFEARLLLGRRASIIAAALLALTPAWYDSGWLILPDIPGTTVSLAAVVVMTAAVQRDRVPWWLLAVAPLAALATAVRYGAPLLLAPALAAITFLYRDNVLRSLKVITATATATLAAVTVVWFVPWVTGANRPPVLVFRERQSGKEIPIPDRIADFGSIVPDLLGPVIGLAILAALAALFIGITQQQISIGPVITLASIAFVIYALLILGVADQRLRYLTPGIPFLVILAAAGLAWLSERLVPAVSATLVAALLVGGVWVAHTTTTTTTTKLLASHTGLRMAARHLGDGMDECVVIASNPQQASWYSGCAALFMPAMPPERVGVPPPPITDRKVFLKRMERMLDGSFRRHGLRKSSPVFVLVRERRDRDPAGDALTALRDVSHDWMAIQEEGDFATIFSLGPANDALKKIRSKLTRLE